MPRIALWNQRKGKDFSFIDRTVSEFFGASGTALYVHKFIGTHQQGDGDSETNPNKIQDVLFLENRDRKYSDEVFELRGIYNVADNDFDLKQFGLFLTGDTIFIEVHLNDMIASIGRKIMSGDVIELPHQRDDALLDGGKAINKFYVVDDATRASDGYSATWFPHIWRLKLVPMTGSQEYLDILDKQAKDPLGQDDGRLGDLIETIGKELQINEEVVKAARRKRNFETRQFWVVPGNEATGSQAWIFAGDGVQPNGALPIGTGTRFPELPNEGDYFLRTDYEPRALFRFMTGRWRIQELDWRRTDWSAAHRILQGFIDNQHTIVMPDGLVLPEKQGLSKALKPRADF